MEEVILKVGNILKDLESNTRYRIIAIVNRMLTLCEMDTTRFNLTAFPAAQMYDLIDEGRITLEEDSEHEIFDEDSLSDNELTRYHLRQNVMHRVIALYEPSMLGLSDKKRRPELKKLLNEYSIPKNTFWRMCRKFFQSGMKEKSLVDDKAFGINKGKQYNYVKKSGRPPEYLEQGIPITEEIRGYFDEALSWYGEGRHKSYEKAYERLLKMHFRREAVVNGVKGDYPMPDNEVPTFNQFYHYAKKHITNQEQDEIKSNKREQRNKKRILIGDERSDAYGPGDLVLIDEVEADVSLVSSIDRNKTIGKPIVYFMVDSYSKIILSAAIGLENNSVAGVTNLLLNLADDKQKLCAKYKIGFDDPRLWPSNIIPRRIRVDRGSEYKSNAFRRICNELGIELQNVPGATGSYKGSVEQEFHQLNLAFNEALEGYGLKEQQYDPNYLKEATLTIEEYTQMIINFVLQRNQHYLKDYRLNEGQMKRKVKKIPALLWEDGVAHVSSPRPITEIPQYLWTLMTPIRPSYWRAGICFKDLYYLPENDPEFSDKMFNAGTKHIPIEMKIDTRTVDAIYYMKDHKLMRAVLDKGISGNAEFGYLTLKEWEEILKGNKKDDLIWMKHNREIGMYTSEVNKVIVDGAKKDTYSDASNMRQTRSDEKHRLEKGNRIEDYLPEDEYPAIDGSPFPQEINDAHQQTDAEQSISSYQSEEDLDEDMLTEEEWARFEGDK